MPIKKKKISELKEASDLKGFFTIGYRLIDGVKESVKYGLEQIQNLYENLVKAISDAQEATTDMRQLETTVGTNEEQRQITENQRVASEHERQVSESERIATEYDRIYAENDRKVAEVERSTSEVARQEAEGVRDSAEAVREGNETTRKEAEVTRVSTESARNMAEQGRKDAEALRVIAENERVTEFATLKEASETATEKANDTASHPTYIGQDHYVYKWNKEAQGYDKTDIYTKGDAGAPFQVNGLYVTLEELQTAIPDGSAVEGVVAVGENEPYTYYAWINGEWQTQGRLQGVDGKSAYQIAVDNGFVGTEAEWLASLQGTIGVDGKPGTDGVSCTHSWNGTTLTIISASGTSSANLKGDKGDKGDTGAQGPIGATGNSFLSGVVSTWSNGISVPTVYSDNWFRSAGASGWYNETYGGGIYMTDSTYVRTYANKAMAAAGGFWKESDCRLKSNITPLKHTLEQILSIPTDKFVMNGKEQIGTIAQEIEKVCPEVVSELLVSKSEVPERGDWETVVESDSEGNPQEYVKVKRVEYEMLGVLALEGVKLLKAEIDKLKEEVRRLKNGRD